MMGDEPSGLDPVHDKCQGVWDGGRGRDVVPARRSNRGENDQVVIRPMKRDAGKRLLPIGNNIDRVALEAETFCDGLGEFLFVFYE